MGFSNSSSLRGGLLLPSLGLCYVKALLGFLPAQRISACVFFVTLRTHSPLAAFEHGGSGVQAVLLSGKP